MFTYDPTDSTYNNILRLVEEVGYTNQSIAADLCEVTNSRSQQILNKLVERGLIERRGNVYVRLNYDGDIPEMRKGTRDGKVYLAKDAILRFCSGDPEENYMGYFSTDKKRHPYGLIKFPDDVIQEALTALLVAGIIEKHGEHTYTLKGKAMPRLINGPW
jgi:predicted transcriptional regulator